LCTPAGSLPVSRAGASVEELDSREQDALGSGGDFEINDLVQEVLSDVPLAEFVGGEAMEVGEFSDGTDVAVDGSFGHSGELEVLDEFVVAVSFEELGGLG